MGKIVLSQSGGVPVLILKEGVNVCVTGGKHAGARGIVSSIEGDIVKLKTDSDEIKTLLRNIFVIK